MRSVDILHQFADSLFAGLLEAGLDAMVCVDAGGQIVLVNAETERLFGYSREDLAGQPVEILVPDAVKARHPGLRAGYAGDPRPMDPGLELSGRRRDGTTFPAEISLSTIGTGQDRLVSAAIRDVTGRRALEAERDRLALQLHASQRLESLGQLAGGVAHDFNNLLAIVSGYAALISETAAGEPAQAAWPSVREDIQQIEGAAKRATGLTRQLLAFGRREVSQPCPLDLNEVVGSVGELLARTLGEHVELRTELAAGLCPVLADASQIEQVLVNLAVNARDAMPGGGTLMICTACTEIDAAGAAGAAGLSPGLHASLTVSDTGTGMSGEVMDRAFEPFFSTKAGAGSGLGLSTVFGIVTQAGGHVWIDSQPGAGAAITIVLPATSQPVQQVTPPPPPGQACGRGGGEIVLVAEDEPALLEMTRRMLARNGYQVITAVNGRDAVEVAGRAPGGIDLLVTDVVMPQMLGTEAALRIRALFPAVKVLFMSGYTQGALDAQGVLDAGVSLIEKPFTEVALLAKLGEVRGAAGVTAAD